MVYEQRIPLVFVKMLPLPFVKRCKFLITVTYLDFFLQGQMRRMYLLSTRWWKCTSRDSESKTFSSRKNCFVSWNHAEIDGKRKTQLKTFISQYKNSWRKLFRLRRIAKSNIFLYINLPGEAETYTNKAKPIFCTLICAEGWNSL